MDATPPAPIRRPPTFPPQPPLSEPFPVLPALAALGARPRWVAYRAVWLPAKRKWTKVPYAPGSDPARGRKAATNDPATWGTLAEATAWARAAGAAGVGYVFRAPPPAADDDEVCGADLDGCRDPATGALAPWARAIVDRLGSYAEASPSGTGVHVLSEGRLPPGWRKRAVPGVPGAAVELYDSGRFLTVTGRHLPGTPDAIRPGALALARLHADLDGAVAPAPAADRDAGARGDDTALLARARGAANGAAFARLWRGETGDHGGDASAADLALCAHLRFWTGGDRARMDRLFRRSGLMRPKWDERRGDRTYAERTLDRALAGGGDGYAGVRGTLVAPGATKVPPPPDGEAFSAFSSSSGESPAARPGPSDAELAEAIGEAPALPPDAALPDALAEEGAVARDVWLEPYIAAARALSPRTPRTLHEAAGLFALATSLARRAYVRVGGARLYPAFFLAFVERSTLYSKTGGLDVLRLLLDAAGLRDLLLPASFTPQALVADLALHVPQAVREAGAAEQARWLERHRHGAQRAVVRDELAGLFEDCTREYNAGLLPLLLKLDGAPGAVDPDLTLTRGLVEVRDVAINLIGATTPAAFRQHAAKPYHWANGLFGRFALLAAGEPPAYAFWPEHVTTLPAAVVDGLKRIYGAFPRPRAAFVYADAAEGARPDGKAGRERPGRAEQRAGPPIVGAAQEGYGAVAFAVEPEAWRAWRRYDAALFGLVQRGATPERLDPTYGRLPTAAVRLALTLAAAEWALDGGPASGLAPLVERRHWAAAQEVAERWRRHAHAVLARALREEAADDAATAAARLVRFLATAGGRLKRGDLQRGLHLSSADLDAALAAAGPRVRTWETDTGGKPARWVALAVGDSVEAATEAASPATDDGESLARATKATKAPHQRREARALVAARATKAPASGVRGPSGTLDPAGQIGRGDAGGTAPDGQHGQEVEP